MRKRVAKWYAAIRFVQTIRDTYIAWDTFNRKRKEEIETKWKTWSIFVFFKREMNRRGGYHLSVENRIRHNLMFEVMFRWPEHIEVVRRVYACNDKKKVSAIGSRAHFILLSVMR